MVFLEEIFEFSEPVCGEIIGIFTMSSLDEEYRTDDKELKSGVGHFIGTGFPGQGKQILLSRHNNTGFRNLDKLKIDDILEVSLGYGTHKYVIEETFIVDKDDPTVIDYSIDEEVLSLSTCYPIRYVGNAPQRYIINAKPVN